MATPKIETQIRAAERTIFSMRHEAGSEQLMAGVGVMLEQELGRGEALVAATREAVDHKEALHAKILGVWQKLREGHAPAWSQWRLYHDLASLKITSAEVRTQLGLGAHRAKGRPKQLRQMHRFYAHAVESPEAIAELATLSITGPILEAALAATEAMLALEADLAQHMLDKRAATHAQHQALKTLNAWRARLLKGYEFAQTPSPPAALR